MTVLLVLLFGLLIFVGAMEWAVIDYSRSRLERLLETRNPRRLADIFEHDEETGLALRAIQLLLVVAVAANVKTMLGDALASSPLVESILAVLIAGGMAIAIDLWIARPFGRRFAEKLLDQTWICLTYLRLVAKPLVLGAELCEGAVNWLYRRPKEEVTTSAIQDEILSAINEGEREGTIFEDAADMMEGLMELHQVQVGEIMIPRPDMVMLKSNATIEEARQIINECGHSRIPVYAQSRDQVLGILYAKDLLPYVGAPPHLAPRDISSLLLREPVYVPESKPVHSLLREFQKGRVHIAVVVDEYGGVAGLVTIEDILEQIVGDIADEHDRAEPPTIRKIDDLRVQVDARTPVEEINELLPVGLPEDGDFETVGGFVSSILGRIPKMGESVEHNRARFTVLDASERAVNHLLIELEPTEPCASTEPTSPPNEGPRGD
jgi:CBS domain containing-hemolysin-like protein